jgi:predicted amidohydrolase
VPGLVDIHTHAARAKDTPALCLADGVTCFDAGSNGADNIEEVVANARAAPNHGRVLINLAKTGIRPDGELNDMSRADVGNGRNGHLWWNVADRAVKQGFVPDTISTDFVDNYRNTRTGRQRLFPGGTVIGGKVVRRA